MPALSHVGLAVAMALTLSACDGKETSANETATAVDGRLKHQDGAGILSGTTLGDGGVGLDPPRYSPWYGSFGVPLLCTTKGESARIDDVRYDFKLKPAGVETWIRNLRDLDEVTDPDAWLPFNTALGEPPLERSGEDGFAGQWIRPVAGTVIDNRCDPEGGGARHELVTTFQSTNAGAWSTRTLVDYTSGGAKYTLVIDWQYIACGSEVELDQDPDC